MYSTRLRFDVCPRPKFHRQVSQYIFFKTAVQLAWVPRDFLCAVSGLAKPFKVTRVESFFSRGFASGDFCLRPKICWPAATPKHPAAPEKNPPPPDLNLFFWRQIPLPLYKGLDDQAPPYLKDWIGY